MFINSIYKFLLLFCFILGKIKKKLEGRLLLARIITILKVTCIKVAFYKKETEVGILKKYYILLNIIKFR